MRHLHAGRKLNRKPSHRKAMFKNLLSSLIEHGRVTTTLAKAKEARSYADRFVTLGKKGTVAARRQAFEWIRDDKLIAKLFSDYAPRFEKRQGGYTRITKIGPRLGDAAEMAILEYLPAEEKKEQKADTGADKKTTKKAAPKTTKKAETAKKEPAKKAKAAKKEPAKKATAKKTSTAKKTTKAKTTAKKTTKSTSKTTKSK